MAMAKIMKLMAIMKTKISKTMASNENIEMNNENIKEMKLEIMARRKK
jgi:hypothetical protein